MVKQARLDEAFGALADPTRRAIVSRLTKGEATVGELARPFAMSLPAVLKHIGVLERSGIVRCEKVGRERRCRLDAARLDTAARWIEERKAVWEKRLDKIGEIVDDRGRR